MLRSSYRYAARQDWSQIAGPLYRAGRSGRAGPLAEFAAKREKLGRKRNRRVIRTGSRALPLTTVRNLNGASRSQSTEIFTGPRRVGTVLNRRLFRELPLRPFERTLTRLPQGVPGGFFWAAVHADSCL